MSSEVQRRIDQLGEQLGRSVVVNDPGIRLLDTSRHYGDEDPVRIKSVLNRDPGSRTIAHVLAQGVSTWSRPGRIPPAPELGLLARIAVPVRWHGELLGVAMVIDQDATLTAEETAQLDDFAHEVAGLLVAERHEADRRRPPTNRTSPPG